MPTKDGFRDTENPTDSDTLPAPRIATGKLLSKTYLIQTEHRAFPRMTKQASLQRPFQAAVENGSFRG